MRRGLLIVLLFTLIFVTASCKSKKPYLQPTEPTQTEATTPEQPIDESSKQPTVILAPSEAPVSDEEEEKSVEEFFIDKDVRSLSYNGYTIIKQAKKAKNKEVSHSFDVPFVVIKKVRKVIGKFAGFDDFPEIIANFGLVSLLGDSKKQLLIEQIEPRTGRFWIVSLFPKYRVLLDTDEYGGSRQEMWVKDVDKDGAFEIKVVTYGCTSIGTTFNLLSTPQPVIIFKYDNKAVKYLPANHFFQAYALQGIEEHIQRLQPTVENPSLTDREALEHGPYFRELTDIFLQYVYAGRENEGWAFFDKFYNLPDRNKVKAAIKADLRKDKIYKFIYRQNKKNHT
jgi:hypothetical protein